MTHLLQQLYFRLQENVTTEKKNLEKKLREAGDTPLLNSTTSDLEVSQLKAEIEVGIKIFIYSLKD